MPVPLEFEIADELSKCIDGRCSLGEFRQWFVPISMDIEPSENLAAIDLAYRIDGILAEASSGNWSEEDLVEGLASVPLPLFRSAENHSGNPCPMPISGSISGESSNLAVSVAA